MCTYSFTFQNECKGEGIDMVAWSKSLQLDRKESRTLSVTTNMEPVGRNDAPFVDTKYVK